MVVETPTLPATRSKGFQDRPPLNSGDRLSRSEFHHRYGQYPEIKKAELVEGVVIVGSPVHKQHSIPHFRFATVLGVYCAGTPGILAGDNQSVILDHENELQPDLCVWVAGEQSAKAEESEKGPLIGAPDLVVEIAASSASHDLHNKLNVYRRNRVREYLVLLAYERETRFFRLADGEFATVRPDADGVTRSQVLPGFWFRSDWFWEGKTSELLQLVQEGLASQEHEEFAAKLSA